MSFEIDNQRDFGKQVRKVAARQLDQAIKALRSRSQSARSRDEGIHAARKRLKEVRALLRLVRDGIGNKRFERENKALRDAARPLSEVRDAAALIDAFQSLEKRYAREIKKNAFRPTLKALNRRRLKLRRRILVDGRTLSKSASAVKQVRSQIERWDLKSGAWKILHSGLERAYKKGHQAMARTIKDPTDENLHEWRKRVKDLRYQLELLEPLWPDVMKATAEQAKVLSDLLGDDHDLAVLRGLLENALKETLSDEGAETLQGLIDRHRIDLQHSSLLLSEKLFAESPRQFVGRLKVYWKTAT